MLYDLLSQDIFEILPRIHPVLTRLLILALAVRIVELLIRA
jgi:hypothetical protein